MTAQASRLPVIYFGHGNPMNAILDNACTKAWRSIGASIPKPRAIHDFGGFPRELYQVQYPAPGDPVLAARVAELLRPTVTTLDDRSWGLDRRRSGHTAEHRRDAAAGVPLPARRPTRTASRRGRAGDRER